MSYSKTKIFNIALSNLGVSAPIQNTLEENPTAILLNNYYDMARDTVLEAHEWSFATAYKVLSEAFETSEQSNWMYSFNYPNDCIAPRAITDTLENKEKKLETATKSNGEKIILTNCNPCILRYTRRVTNETFFAAAIAFNTNSVSSPSLQCSLKLSFIASIKLFLKMKFQTLQNFISRFAQALR